MEEPFFVQPVPFDNMPVQYDDMPIIAKKTIDNDALWIPVNADHAGDL